MRVVSGALTVFLLRVLPASGLLGVLYSTLPSVHGSDQESGTRRAAHRMPRVQGPWVDTGMTDPQPTYTVDQLPALLAGQKKPRKYRNEPCDYQGQHFDSRREMRRYKILLLEMKAGVIRELRVHTSWDLHIVGGIKLARYTDDFDYMTQDGSFGEFIVEDVKSPQTRKTTDYRLRKAWMKLEYGIVIREILK